MANSAALGPKAFVSLGPILEPLTEHIQEDAPGRDLKVSIDAVDFQSDRNIFRKGRRSVCYCSRFCAGDVPLTFSRLWRSLEIARMVLTTVFQLPDRPLLK